VKIVSNVFFRIALVACASLCRAAESNVANWLERNDVASLDKYFQGIQRDFENGSLSEDDLRNAFRPIYVLDAKGVKNLTSWAARAPRSYAAHLARGIYLKKVGEKVRGEKFVQEIPVEKLTEANEYFARANRELRKSLPLTSKPYLSIFHMLSIAQWMGKQSDAEILLAVANKMYPSNAMSRCRFVKILLPRWGGSYAEVDAFIAHTRKEGVPATVIYGLVAIEEDDIGRGFESHGDHDAAREHFETVLQLAKQSGVTFAVDWLPASRYFVCAKGNSASYC
jgi:hypothetical protein